MAVACDLPSGVATDDGALLSPIGRYDLTVTFGALKPAHRLMPAMARMGRVVLADIGIDVDTQWFEIGEPELPPLDPEGHKYSRGLVHCLAGQMPGAIALAAIGCSQVRGGLCPGLNFTADRRACRRQSSRRAERTFRTSGSAASWLGRDWAKCRRC